MVFNSGTLTEKDGNPSDEYVGGKFWIQQILQENEERIDTLMQQKYETEYRKKLLASYDALEKRGLQNVEDFRELMITWLRQEFHVVPTIYKVVPQSNGNLHVYDAEGKRRNKLTNQELFDMVVGGKDFITPKYVGYFTNNLGDDSQYVLVYKPVEGYSHEFQQNIQTMEAILITQRLFRELSNLYSINEDPLTGCFGRRMLDEVTSKYFPANEAHENVSPERNFALLILDIDQFKSWNDEHGYMIGDEVLRSVGHILRTSCRLNLDYVFRLGGDEFLILIDVTNTSNQDEAINRIRNAIIEKVAELKINENKIRVSIGTTPYEQRTSFPILQNRAEEGLARSKSPLGALGRHVAAISARLVDVSLTTDERGLLLRQVQEIIIMLNNITPSDSFPSKENK